MVSKDDHKLIIWPIYFEKNISRSKGRKIAKKFSLEKPDVEKAEALISAGCVWNAGIFVVKACMAADLIAKHAPEILPSQPRVPNPPGTMMPSTSSRCSTALASVISVVSIHLTCTLQPKWIPACSNAFRIDA